MHNFPVCNVISKSPENPNLFFITFLTPEIYHHFHLLLQQRCIKYFLCVRHLFYEGTLGGHSLFCFLMISLSLKKKKKSPLSKKGRYCRIIFSDLEKIYIDFYLFKLFLTARNRHLICGFNVQDLV